MGFERRFVELRVVETGQGSSATLHGRNEALLGDDDVLNVAEPAFVHEVQGDLRLAPHRIERIVPQQQEHDDMEHVVARVGQVSHPRCGAKGRPDVIDRSRQRMRPEGGDRHRILNLRSIREEVVLFDQIASEPGETKTLGVTLKNRSEAEPEVAAGVRESAVHAMPHTEIQGAAQLKTKEIAIGNIG